MSFDALETNLKQVMTVFRRVLKWIVLVFKRVGVWHTGETQAWVSLDPCLGLTRPGVGQARPTLGSG
jgi:hypothetical protein